MNPMVPGETGDPERNFHAFWNAEAQRWDVVTLSNTAEGVPERALTWADAAADPVWRKEMDDFLEMAAASDAETLDMFP